MTTPRDDIGLSERLRSTTEMMACRCSVPMDLWQEHSTVALEAATQLDALQARVIELEATDCYANLISIIADIREKSGVGGKPMLSELADAIGSKLVDAESRATRAKQERDAAYELLKPFADAAERASADIYFSIEDFITEEHLKAARELIRRLAAGDGEGKN